MSKLLLLAAAVLFVIVAGFAFGWLGTVTFLTMLGLLAAGLACLAAAALIP